LTVAQFAVGVRDDLQQRCVRVLEAHPAGAVLVSFAESPRVASASYLTVQLDATTHILPRPEFLECVNHSCDPNVAFDMAQMALVAVRDLLAGDELVYFYPSTEWSMAQPFTCGCGAALCLGTIDGAERLPREVLDRYALSPFIRDALAQRG
jgi:hypothetical protein